MRGLNEVGSVIVLKGLVCVWCIPTQTSSKPTILYDYHHSESRSQKILSVYCPGVLVLADGPATIRCVATRRKAAACLVSCQA